MLSFIILVLFLDWASKIEVGYKYVRFREPEIYIVEVRINGIDRVYSYLTDGHTYQIGELVLVPLGPADSEVSGIVVSRSVTTADSLPVPLSKMKSVITSLEYDTISMWENHAP